MYRRRNYVLPPGHYWIGACRHHVATIGWWLLAVISTIIYIKVISSGLLIDRVLLLAGETIYLYLGVKVCVKLVPRRCKKTMVWHLLYRSSFVLHALLRLMSIDLLTPQNAVSPLLTAASVFGGLLQDAATIFLISMPAAGALLGLYQALQFIDFMKE